MNKTLIIFGLIIIAIGIFVAVFNLSKQKESFNNIEHFDMLQTIAETFWEEEEEAGENQKNKEKKTESAASKAQIQTESVLSKEPSVEAAVESETARQLSKKTCMNSVIEYATSLMEQAKIEQDRSSRALKFIAKLKRSL